MVWVLVVLVVFMELLMCTWTVSLGLRSFWELQILYSTHFPPCLAQYQLFVRKAMLLLWMKVFIGVFKMDSIYQEEKLFISNTTICNPSKALWKRLQLKTSGLRKFGVTLSLKEFIRCVALRSDDSSRGSCLKRLKYSLRISLKCNLLNWLRELADL